jgi:hypothetical protein
VLTARCDTGSDALPQISREAECVEQMEHLFRNEFQRECVEGEWHLFFPRDTAAFVDLAKSFDLTILCQLWPETWSSGFPPGEIVIASGRPVLVIPYAGTFDSIGRPALGAWDGTRQAVRAVQRALPLLGHADAVTVTYVGAHQASLSGTAPLERISRHLQRTGFAPNPKRRCG